MIVHAVRNFRLRTPDGEACTPESFLAEADLEPGESLERDVEVVLQSGRVVPMRLIIIRKTDAATARATKRLRRLRLIKRKQNAASPEALGAAAHIFLLTSLTRGRATVAQVASAYRFRWQVEMRFKRWKSIGGLDKLRARGDLAETYVLAKLLCAALIEAVLQQAAISPWGAHSTRARAPETPDTTPQPPQAEAASAGTPSRCSGSSRRYPAGAP